MLTADKIYPYVIRFIRKVKWAELQLLQLFSSWIINKGISICEELGIVCHFSDESYQNWSPSDEKKALWKCKGQYETLVHIRVHDKQIFVDAINTCDWALGDGFVSKKYDFCKDENDLVELARRLLEHNTQDLYYNWWNRIWDFLEFKMFNLQTKERSTEVTDVHYDLGNDIYEAMLDPNMQYTCAYWAKADNLNDAQLAKMELIAQKLKLKPGMRVLDFGCGWGMLCKYLAEKHGVSCVGINISKEGVAFGKKACEGLPVEIRLQDYRDIEESFDRIVCVGMIEHVGFKNYGEFFKIVEKNLKDDGIFLLHTIGNNHPNYPNAARWLCKNIFPGGHTPMAQDLIKASEGRFIMEDWHNFSLDYSKTLAAWRDNFQRSWPTLRKTYGEEFYRMWIYYLTYCEAAFVARRSQLWHIVFSKDGLKEGYRSPR